jgi:hypothetical protein
MLKEEQIKEPKERISNTHIFTPLNNYISHHIKSLEKQSEAEVV